MKKLLLFLIVFPLLLVSCRTYCENNFPSPEPVYVLDEEPTLQEVGYPGDFDYMLEVLELFAAGEISKYKAMTRIAAEYISPLITLGELWQDWATSTKGRIGGTE